MPATRLKIFISSVQKELAEERRAVADFIRNDPLLRRFFDVFLFEELPASDSRADAVYIAEVERAAVYVALFGNEYGGGDSQGLSPTEREFDHASAHGKVRLIFVKGMDDAGRHPKMCALIAKAGQQLIRRRFDSIPELTAALYSSLVDYLEVCGIIQARHFEDRPCPDATFDDVNTHAVSDFVRLARLERQFPLPVKTPMADVLAHLHLLCGDHPTSAAIALFGRDPQRFFPAAEVRCMHFHGTEIQRPVPFYRIFKGTLFEQVDMAVDFVMSKLNRSVGTRSESAQAPVRYEVPHDVIREAIVNAIAHRDYTSAGAVQVSVFADRVEVWNPGTLPPPLTLESLRQPHGSIARNPRICEALFLARYMRNTAPALS
jgi:ATP-dependent DNA helicase RecG